MKRNVTASFHASLIWVSLNESMSIMHRVSENEPLLYMNRIKTINVSARDTVSGSFKTLIPNRRAWN